MDYPITYADGTLICTVCDRTEAQGHDDMCPIELGL